ncbi:MAG: hypothetical protein J0H94_14075 [Rhizobiales bacterium]|nr:hypothetical protein [Hyphomicrobiales bacterium]
MGDTVVEAMALVNRGFFRLCIEEAERRVEDQDLAATLALSGDLDPVQGTALYCTILWACRNFADWSRAMQWQESLERWCAPPSRPDA